MDDAGDYAKWLLAFERAMALAEVRRAKERRVQAMGYALNESALSAKEHEALRKKRKQERQNRKRSRNRRK